MSTATLTSTLSASPGRGLRRVKNTTAGVFVTLCFLVALVPLVWLLYTVIDPRVRLA